MPIYEFKCRKCGHDFEELVTSSNAAAVNCPACAAKDLQRKFSVFAASSRDQSGSKPLTSSTGCSSCQSGHCHTCH